MQWKFWEKAETSVSSDKVEKLPGPKGIPEVIGRYIVVSLQKDPDWVWTLKAVMMDKPDSRDEKNIRIYDPAKIAAAEVAVKNYRSFDTHPELILYEGWFNIKSHKVEIKEISGPQSKAA